MNERSARAGFGKHSLELVSELVSQRKWLKPAPFASRVAYLRKRGASDEVIRKVTDLWAEWRKE